LKIGCILFDTSIISLGVIVANLFCSSFLLVKGRRINPFIGIPTGNFNCVLPGMILYYPNLRYINLPAFERTPNKVIFTTGTKN
jgi:hypothetical protein